MGFNSGFKGLNWKFCYEKSSVFFLTGWEATWRKYLTMPKVLKDFNPKFVGYSVRDSLDFMRDSKFNPLKTKRNLLYIRSQSVPHSKHFPPRL